MKSLISLVLLCTCLAIPNFQLHAMNNLSGYYFSNQSDLTARVLCNETLEEKTPKIKPLLLKYKLQIDLTNKACAAVLNLPESLPQLDPHVGDTKCEKRASMVLSIDRTPDRISMGQETIALDTIKAIKIRTQAISTEIEKLLNGQCKPEKTKLIGFPDFLAQHNLLPSHQLPEMLCLLKDMVLLTEAKLSHFRFSDDSIASDNMIMASIDYNKSGLASYGIGEKSFKTIISNAQKRMAQESVIYLQQELLSLQGKAELPSIHTSSPTPLASLFHELNQAIGQENSCCLDTDNNSRVSAAYFPAIISLYGTAIMKQTPILLKIARFIKPGKYSNEMPTFYKICQLYVPEGNIFKPAQLENHTNKKAIILDALSFKGSYEEFKRMVEKTDDLKKKIEYHQTLPADHNAFYLRLQHQDLFTNLCADASIHPQFTSDPKDNDIRIENCIFRNGITLPKLAMLMAKLQTHALHEGVCYDNMSFFCLRHVYADALTNQKIPNHQIAQLGGNND